MSGEREVERGHAERPTESPEARPIELDPQIKAIIDELLETGRARWMPEGRDTGSKDAD